MGKKKAVKVNKEWNKVFADERVCVHGKQMIRMNTNYKIGWGEFR